jgi:hypothetical protein
MNDIADTKNVDTDQNLYMIFGCRPQVGVPAKSTIAKNYTECVKQYVKEHGGLLKLPDAVDKIFKRDYEKNSTERREVTK